MWMMAEQWVGVAGATMVVDVRLWEERMGAGDA